MMPGKAAAKKLGRLGAADSLRRHWPEYLMEAAALGIFMLSAGGFTTLLEYPGSPGRTALLAGWARRALIGLAMGGTATGLIYSPWGKRSGAHMNPAVTLTFLWLRKIPPWDAFYYVVFQFLGGLGGVLLVAGLLGPAFTRAPVSFVVTVPGPAGAGAAFAGETAVAVLMMGMIVSVSNRRTLARYTGLLAGILIALYVAFEAPLSGFGMNPARTTASALPSGIWTSFWVYLCAPLLGMLAAGEGYARIKGAPPVRCCKLHHRSSRPCIFCGERILAGF